MSSVPSALGVDHFGVTVPDLDTAVEDIQSLLGGTVRYRRGPIQDPCGHLLPRQFGAPRQAVARIAMLRLGPVTDLELAEYRTPGRADPPAPLTGDWGAVHLALAVADVDGAVRYLAGRDGMRVLAAPIAVPGEPGRIAVVYTPGGLTLRLRGPGVEPPDTEPLAAQSPAAQSPAADRPGAGPADWTPPPDGLPTACRVEHLGITVPDLTAALRLFRDGLGAEVVHREPPRWVDAAIMAALGAPAAGVVQRALLRLGRAAVEVAQYELPGQRQVPPGNADPGGHHLAFAVADVDAAAGRLGGLRGVAPLGDPCTEKHGGVTGARWQYLRASWGLHLELLTPPPAADRPGTGEPAATNRRGTEAVGAGTRAAEAS